jgi:HEAT repeat protein
MQDGGKKERLAAMLALASLGPQAADAIPELWAAAKDRDRDISDGALAALMKISKPVVPLLLKAFLSDDETLSGKACWIFEHLGPAEAAEFMPPLVRHLRERGPHQWQVIGLVGHFPEYGSQAIPTLVAILKTPLPPGPEPGGAEMGLRISVGGTLTKIGRPAVNPLVRALPQMDRRGRLFAACALGEMREGAAEAVPMLLNMMCRDPYPYNREGAWAALADIGEAGVSRLVEALDDKDPAIRRGALFVLGYLGSRARLAVPHLVNRLKSEDPEVRREVAAALSEISLALTAPPPPLWKAPPDDPHPVYHFD